ncbi:MAG: HAD family hydrolase [Alicyclobacillus herbarius]|uniref:HAD family hydrolase n=1 Tax=Alicyclobacillus herbarius TaxID=122960 RepID=UPI002354F81F|nr:HAD family hydrolase [Alicyclobacillus herbarius]MCL6631493.1 HAD family hydrolase [Alicyclobacillus herbarius]
MDIRMVFLDIDGTLVHDRRLVPSAHRVVRGLQNNGIEVALCTGRSVLHGRKVQAELGVRHCVYFNGALTYSKGHIIQSFPLSAAVVQRMISFTKRYKLPLILHTTESAVTFESIPGQFRPLLDAYDFPPIQVIEETEWSCDSQSVFQSNVLLTPDWDDRVRAKFPECLLYRWDFHAIDLQKGSCDKSVGAQILLSHLGIRPDQAIHIGDGGNDIPLFQQVGISVAMGNAAPDVQKQASLVTTTVEEDGVLRACQSLGLLK